MAEAIKLLMNGNKPMAKFIRNLGSAAAVKKSKVIPIHKTNKIQAPQLQMGSTNVEWPDTNGNVIEMKRRGCPALSMESSIIIDGTTRASYLGIPATGVLVEQVGGVLGKSKFKFQGSCYIRNCNSTWFRAAIQKNHPRANRLLPEGEGVDYLSLGISYEGLGVNC